jgi:tRNA-modifying protein YgfZ
MIDEHERGEGLLMGYGPAEANVHLVAAFDPVEVEYAGIRRHAVVFDNPSRATLVVTGADRLSFLNRMLTQDLEAPGPLGKVKSGGPGLGVWEARRSFWLSRKGRIDADLRVLNLGDSVVLDVDVHALERTRTGLEGYLISEDAAIGDAAEEHHRLSLHGPASAAILAKIARRVGGPADVSISDIQPGQVMEIELDTGAGFAPGSGSGPAPVRVIVDRQDTTGEIGLELLAKTKDARAVYAALSTPWALRERNMPAAPQTGLARRIGWHALNIARIEAGTPMYFADFGPDSLPAETGVLDDRVSFKKGCYLGQEVVARMHALGHPKQRLVALRVHAGADEPQAETGTLVYAGEAADAAVVGAVTSSCLSPMLGQAPIAFAMVKWANAVAGAMLSVGVRDANGGARVSATVQERLGFLKR